MKNKYKNKKITTNNWSVNPKKTKKSKYDGYLMVECLTYLCLASFIVSSILLMITSTMSIYKKQTSLYDLNEVAIKTEDIIRQELYNSTECLLTKHKIGSDAYTPIRRLNYMSYDNYLEKNTTIRKSIVHTGNKLYIDIDKPYQISNHIRKFEVMPVYDSDGRVLNISIKLTFIKNTTKLVRSFVVFY